MKNKVFSFSGEKGFKNIKKPIVFIHGTGMDHSVWTLPTRYFLRKDRTVISVDLPGHGRSKGPILNSISELSHWLIDYLDSLDVNEFSIVGHSMGSLIALETSAMVPDRSLHLVMVGTAFPMNVSEPLLEAAKNNEQAAIDILTYFGYSYSARIGSNSNPGMWMIENTKRLLENSQKDVIYSDLKACSNYSDGLLSAKKVEGEVMFILGENDFLTPAYKAKDLISSFKNPIVKNVRHSGHTLLMEKPNEVLDYLIEIL